MRALRILAAATLVATGATAQAQTNMVRMPMDSVYYVQQGDTLIGIAAESFMNLYEHNIEAVEEVWAKGKPSPGRIVAGMKLIIPGGTLVNPKVAEAINIQAETRRKAEAAFAEAEEHRSRLASLGAGCERADSLLADARRFLAAEPGFANLNHIQAYEHASLAARTYEQAHNMALLAGQVKQLSETQVSEHPTPHPGTVVIENRTPQQEPVISWVIGGALALALALLSWAHGRRALRRDEERQRRFVHMRLLHHKQRLTAMSRP